MKQYVWALATSSLLASLVRCRALQRNQSAVSVVRGNLILSDQYLADWLFPILHWQLKRATTWHEIPVYFLPALWYSPLGTKYSFYWIQPTKSFHWELYSIYSTVLQVFHIQHWFFLVLALFCVTCAKSICFFSVLKPACVISHFVNVWLASPSNKIMHLVELRMLVWKGKKCKNYTTSALNFYLVPMFVFCCRFFQVKHFILILQWSYSGFGVLFLFTSMQETTNLPTTDVLVLPIRM